MDMEAIDWLRLQTHHAGLGQISLIFSSTAFSVLCDQPPPAKK
jgi:hypothetical protein